VALFLPLVELREPFRKVADSGCFAGRIFRLVRGLKLAEVPFDRLVGLSENRSHSVARDASLLAIDRPELTSIDGHQLGAEQIHSLADQRELPADLTNRIFVVPSKVCDRLEVRPQ